MSIEVAPFDRKRRMRHPLRNDWDNFRVTILQLSTRGNADGAMARAMLALMPAFLDFLEEARDRNDKPGDTLVGITTALANIIAQTIKQKVAGSPRGQREALRVMLSEIERAARPRLASTGTVMDGGLILPGRG